MNNKIIIGLCILSMVIGAAVTRTYWQRTETKTEIQIVDHVITKTHTVVLPDGTKTVDSTKTEDKNTDKEVVDVKSKERLWRVSIGSDTNHNYIGIVELKLLGPISVGAVANTNGSAGAVIGIEF